MSRLDFVVYMARQLAPFAAVVAGAVALGLLVHFLPMLLAVLAVVVVLPVLAIVLAGWLLDEWRERGR